MSKTVFTITVPIAVTQRDVEDILTMAFEGGIDYWCNRADLSAGVKRGELSSGTYYAPHGFEWRLVDAETNKRFDKLKEDYPEYRHLTLETLQKGMEKWCAVEHPDNKFDVDDMDSDDADYIVQCACFGEVVFG